jgi:hypothetical protein
MAPRVRPRRVPNYTRYAVGRWGLCADEYVENGNWPPQLYVRISNRLQGEVLLTQNNIANPRSKPDGVSMGCWEFDQHTVSRHAVPDPTGSTLIAMNEGYMRAELTWPHLSCRQDGACRGCVWRGEVLHASAPPRAPVRSCCAIVLACMPRSLGAFLQPSGCKVHGRHQLVRRAVRGNGAPARTGRQPAGTRCHFRNKHCVLEVGTQTFAVGVGVGCGVASWNPPHAVPN